MNKFFVTKNGTFIKCCWSDINTRKMEHIVADMQKKEPDCEFKLYSYGDDEYEDDCYDYDSDEVDYNKGYQWHTKY